MSFNKILLRIATGVGCFVMLVIVSLVIITFAFGDRIKSLAITQINKQLATEVKVNGEIRFSFFSHFPYGSVTFEKVVVKETLSSKNDLLNCEKISLLFNILNLMKKNYVIEKVTAEKGNIMVHIDSQGNRNYDIFNKTGSDSSDFSLRITAAELHDFSIHYLDERNLQEYSFNAGDANLKGNFSATKFTLIVEADAVSNFLKSKNTDYLPQRKLKVSGEILCDLLKNEYVFQNSMIVVNGNSFHVTGKVSSVENGNDLHLKIMGDDLMLHDIISLLPESYKNQLAEFSADGNLEFTWGMDGIESGSSSPCITSSFQLNNAFISHHDVAQAIQGINLKGTFTNGKNQNRSTSEISIQKLSATIDGNDIRGSFLLRDFNHPLVDVMMDGSVQLSKIYPMLKVQDVKSMEGIVNFSECYYRGSLSQLTSSSNISKMNAGGKFEIDNVKIATTAATYEKLNGRFEIRNNDISFSNCSFIAGNSDLRFEGSVTNFFPFIISTLDSGHVKQKIGITVQLASHLLNWEDLVGTSSAPSSSDYSIPSVFYLLAGSVSGNVDHFTYDKFNAENIHGKVLFLPGNIYFNDIGMNAEKGTISASGKLNISNPAHSKLELTSTLNDLDISQLFNEFNDFDQSALTHKNLKGVASATVSMQSTWDDNRFNKDKLHAIADVTIMNGELNNFEPMMALATFVKMNELRNIRFSRLQNQLEIKNQQVYIPATQIFSSALNVQLSGTHSFSNIIDYKIQLNLLRLLTDKFHKSDFDAEASDQTTEGFLNLYLTMTGPADNPVIKFDKKSVKQKIATDLAHEKSNLKSTLKKEFNKQETSQQQAKDFQPPEGIHYFEFEDSLQDENNMATETESTTQQNQKKALGDFKKIFSNPR